MRIIVKKLNHVSLSILCMILGPFIHFEMKFLLKFKKEQNIVCGFPYTCNGNRYKRSLSYNELLSKH